MCKTSEELRNAEREVSRLRSALERNEKQYVNQAYVLFLSLIPKSVSCSAVALSGWSR